MKMRYEIGDMRYERRRSACFSRISYLIPRISHSSRGFTLVEVLVGAAVFLVVSLAAYNAYIGLFRLIDLSQYKILAVNLANEQFESARNMPYVDVGIVGGIPSGKLVHKQTVIRGGVTFKITTTVRNLDLPFDGLIGGSPNDLSPADNKLVDITVSCDGCRDMQPISLTGQVAPKILKQPQPMELCLSECLMQMVNLSKVPQ